MRGHVPVFVLCLLLPEQTWEKQQPLAYAILCMEKPADIISERPIFAIIWEFFPNSGPNFPKNEGQSHQIE